MSITKPAGRDLTAGELREALDGVPDMTPVTVGLRAITSVETTPCDVGIRLAASDDAELTDLWLLLDAIDGDDVTSIKAIKARIDDLREIWR